MFQSDSNTLATSSPDINRSIRCESFGDETLVIGSPGIKEEKQTESISIATSYCSEWEKLFKGPDLLKSLHDYGIEGRLRSSRFRSVCWKVYLETLPDDYDQWITKTKEWRDRYEDLKDKLLVNPRETEVKQVNDPLSQADESPWNRFFQDNELRLTIKQDVIRTKCVPQYRSIVGIGAVTKGVRLEEMALVERSYPRIEFFHTDSIHSMMVDILFVYAKLKPDVSYRQGMHELLAPLIFVLHCDHQAFLHASEIEKIGIIKMPKERDVLNDVLDPRYIEHDAFSMFCQIMETAEHWYVSKELSPTVQPKNVFQSQPFARPQDMNPSNVIVNKLTRIQDYLLKKYDPELHMYLERMEIPPQIYGIRWVRLLFGREFPMQDLLVVWDAIFADSISFDLVDYIFVAMLLYLRDALLSSDYPTCLHFLMKYPPIGDVNYFIQKARFLRDPNEHYCPPHYTYQKPANFIHSSYGDVFQGMNGLPGAFNTSKQNSINRGGNTKIAEKASSLMSSGFASLTRRFSSTQKQQRRQMSLPISAINSKTSHDQHSPASDILPHSTTSQYASSHKRKGSSASMSQLEDRIAPYPQSMRGAMSNQSLARTELSGGGSAQSLEEGVPAEYMPLEARGGYVRGASLPRRTPGVGGGKRGVSHTTRNCDLEQRISFLLGRINDIENMCMKCADKMDGHIDKLQAEMLRKEMDNEDELLLSLAGLKVVKDVLKGELKPSALFFDDEISIHDDHYCEDPSQITSTGLQPQESNDSGYHYKNMELNRHENVTTNSSSPDFSSDTDFTSPEDAASCPVGKEIRPRSHNVEEDQPRSPSAILKTEMLKQREVEMSSFQTSSSSEKDEITTYKLPQEHNGGKHIQQQQQQQQQVEYTPPSSQQVSGNSISVGEFVGGFKNQLFPHSTSGSVTTRQQLQHQAASSSSSTSSPGGVNSRGGVGGRREMNSTKSSSSNDSKKVSHGGSGSHGNDYNQNETSIKHREQ